MSDIRVAYSGLIAFVISITSVITGMIFTLIVTRKLSPEEFGIWAIIGSMILYFLVVEPIISFWSTRQIARGEQIGKTSLLSSSVFSLGLVPLYIILTIFVSHVNPLYLNTMLLGGILLPLSFVSLTLDGINLAHRPQASSYGLLIFELVKIPAGFLLVYLFGFGVNGAIFATIIGYASKIIILTYFAKGKIKNKFSLDLLKYWIRLSWIPLYSRIGRFLGVVDVVIFSSMTGSVIGVAYYSAAFTIANIVSYAAQIPQGLFPKLLAKGSHEYIKDTLTKLFYFAIPLLGISVLFAKPALYALNPAYAIAASISIILVFRVFCNLLTVVIYQILQSIENVDVEQNASYSKLAKSKLFIVPTLFNIQNVIYVVLLMMMIFILNSTHRPIIELITWWASIGVIVSVPFLIHAWILLKKNIDISFPYVNILKYILATIGIIIVYMVTSPITIVYSKSIYNFFPGLILQLGLCLGVYILITYIIDNKTRLLFKSIIGEFVSRK